jgi:serine/threonine protein kinase
MSDTTPNAALAAILTDRYRIERQLGQGGMATVYLAQDLKLEREVALKVLRPELGAVLGTERFLAEVKITARLDHPHILTLMTRSTVIASIYSRNRMMTEQMADLYIHCPLAEWGLLDFEAVREIAARGYSLAAGELREWRDAAVPRGA